jgi:hypothetical protein
LPRKEVYLRIHALFDDWVSRLAGENYHGGDEYGPDHIDFRFFSEVQRVKHMPAMQGIMRTRPQDCRFTHWFKRMERDCRPNNQFY